MPSSRRVWAHCSMAFADLHGYADRLGAAPGERLALKVHSAGGAPWSVRLVGYAAREDGEIATVDLGREIAAEVEGAEQPIDAGSCIVVDGDAFDCADGIELSLRIWFRRGPRREAALIGRWDAAARAGVGVMLRPDRRLVLRTGGVGRVAELVADETLETGTWHEIMARCTGAGGEAELRSAIVPSGGNVAGYVHVGGRERRVRATAMAAPRPTPGCPLVVGAHIRGGGSGQRFGGHFTGKVEAPSVRLAGTLAGAWDLGANLGPGGAPGDAIADVSGRGPGAVLRQRPARCVTGSRWDGTETDYRLAPEQYAAVHLHETDLEDAEWRTGVAWDVPADLPSGIYGLQVTSTRGRDTVPLVVRPAAGSPCAPLLLVLPTATYLAYANDHMALEVAGAELALAHTPVLEEAHRFLGEHPEYGLALYDRHPDGSPVMYSSRLRPIASLRHDFASASSGRTWGLMADLQLASWLQGERFSFDVVTDEDLQREGVELLSRYTAVVTGAHPEYVSARMLDAHEAYVAEGGRLLYLGGNGFWWVTAFHPERPHLIEVRRGQGGTPWDVAPGEARHGLTGEPGGLWGSRGRPAQRLVGVGYTASGFDRSGPYRRAAASRTAPGAALFDGVEGDVFGAFGTAGGGAAGLELDRADPVAGTPPQALVLASSVGHSGQYLGIGADALAPTTDTTGRFNPRVRADLVCFGVPGGGGVFATGSIAWVSALGHDGGENDVARVTRNALNLALSSGFGH